MVSAIWSMPPYEANQMPLKFFLKFFQNHGLFKLKNRPQWYTVSNRSRTYVENINFNGMAITLKSENGPATTIIDRGHRPAPTHAGLGVDVSARRKSGLGESYG